MSSVSSASGNNAAYQAYKSDMFKKLDADGSGDLSKDEMAAAKPKSPAGAFTESQSATTSSSPESFFSGDAMAVLMLMKQQGGMFESSTDGDPSAAYLAQQMDADGDGAITEAEFVASRPKDASEDDAIDLFESIDTEGEGSITAEQLDAGMKGSAPPPPMGGAPGGSSTGDGEEETFDALDTNKDGVVSQDEFLAFNPGAIPDKQGDRTSSDGTSMKIKLLEELMERLGSTQTSTQQQASVQQQGYGQLQALEMSADESGTATA